MPLLSLLRPLLILLLAIAAVAAPATAAPPANRPTPGYVRVRIETSAGPIVIAADVKHAPKTSANFLAYVDDGRLDDTSFYRSARRRTDPKFGFIQGGISTDRRRSLPPIDHEPTDLTGIRHLDGVISMARGGDPGSAMGNFFIMIGPVPGLDARPGKPGYAAFGHVVAGMDVVKRILALRTGGGVGAMKGQMLQPPVRLISARRLDGKPRPTTTIKPWLLNIPGRK